VIEAFDLNEKLKETLVLEYEAYLAYSKYFENGVPLILEPFLETTVRWEKDVSDSIISKSLEVINLAKKAIDEKCDMTVPQLEYSLGHPQIVWAIFNQD